jgi:hypothetical protein
MDIEKIKADVTRVISWSQGIPVEDSEFKGVDDIIDKWLSQKKWVIDAFGGEPIYEYPEKFTFKASNSKLENSFNNFVSEVKASAYENPALNDFSKFIEAQTKEAFFENRVARAYTYKGEVIYKGDKLLRSFKHFFTDKEVLKHWQDKASQVIQKQEISGRLCFSVHPLDFLSASENNNGWESCHSLHGDYRAGNLSYLMDRCTIMCYIKSDAPDVLIHSMGIPWNNKKWRMWCFISDNRNIIFSGRQYPFELEDILNEIRPILFSALGYTSDDGWSNWSDKYISYFGSEPLRKKYFMFDKTLISPEDIITEENELFYDDLISSSIYVKPFYMTNRYKYWLDPVFTIGGDVPCPICGKGYVGSYDNDGHSMLCENCGYEYDENINYCEICDERIRPGEEYWINDTCLCEDCYLEKTVECEDCGDRYFINDVDDIIFDEESEAFICFDCLDTRKRRKLKGEL